MNYKTLYYKTEGKAGIITVNRPKAMNALNSLFFKEFNEVLDNVEEDKDLRTLIITGEGKAFVAGADISEMKGMSIAEAEDFSATGQNSFKRLENLEIPVIAAVNGFALGGGCELALACDIRIAGEYAKFGLPEVSLGLIPGYAGTQRISRIAGLSDALFLTTTGDMVDANYAEKIRLVQKVVKNEDLMQEAIKIAKSIAAKGKNAVSKAKQVVRKGYNSDFEESVLIERNEFSKLFNTEEMKEGVTAFMEKRKPNW